MTDGIFHSAMRGYLSKFVEEKRALGYRYIAGEERLHAFDRYLQNLNPPAQSLPESVVGPWVAKRVNESATTHSIRARVVREFARFLRRHGIEAHIPDTRSQTAGNTPFVPKIFTRLEVAGIIRATAALPVDRRSPLRHIVFPEIFAVLYGCGLRCGETLRLAVRDVDLEDGVLKVLQGKFRKDRLVPMSPSLSARLRQYAQHVGQRDASVAFFQAPHGGAYRRSAVYVVFRRALRSLGIPRGGRGRGPRVHDLRHTFAVHRLEAWYRAGSDLGAKLPVLAAYMGHRDIYGTQRYLRLTAELYPEIAERMQAAVGSHIPRLGPG